MPRTQLLKKLQTNQGIIDFTGTEAWQFFSHVFVTPIENKELFTPTQNRMTASVSLVPETLVILNARSLDWLRRAQTKTTMRNKWTRREWHFFRSETQTINPCHSLGYARGNESIVIFNDLWKPIKTHIYARKKNPFESYPAAKHPNTANLRLQTYDKNTLTFLSRNTGRRV